MTSFDSGQSSSRPLRVLFAGTPEVAAQSLRRMHAALAQADTPSAEICSVLTRPPAPVGRKKVLTPSPVATAATELGLPVIESNRVDAEIQEQLKELDLDVAAVVAYGALVPEAGLGIPRHGWLNLHFSLLPQWRGAAPVQHAILAGDTQTGASVFALEKGLDTGPVYGTISTPITPTTTTAGLLAELADSGTDLLVDVVRQIGDGTASSTPQEGEVSLAPKLSLADGLLDFTRPAAEVSARSRAVTPEPGAWTTLDGDRVKLGPVLAIDDAVFDVELEPGEVAAVAKDAMVGTGGGGHVRLSTVQPAGRKPMPAADWLRGRQRGDAKIVFGEPRETHPGGRHG